MRKPTPWTNFRLSVTSGDWPRCWLNLAETFEKGGSDVGYVAGLEDGEGGHAETQKLVQAALAQMARNAENGNAGGQMLTVYEDSRSFDSTPASRKAKSS
jgi:hypothetical protein